MSRQDWQKKGIYRIFDVGRQSGSAAIKWDSDDAEFKQIFEAAALSRQAPVALGQNANVFDARPPSVTVAIFDCGITRKSGAFFAAQLASDTFVAPIVKPALDKEAAAQRSYTEANREPEDETQRQQIARDEQTVSTQEAEIARLNDSKKPLQQQRNQLSTQMRAPGIEEKDKLELKTKIEGIDKDLKAIPGQTRKLQEDPAYTQAKARLDERESKKAAAEEQLQKNRAGNHGTFCAGRVAWGCKLIKLLDVRMGFGHSASNNNPEDWRNAFRWAMNQTDKRCDIVSCSVLLPFDGKNPATGKVIDGDSPGKVIRDNPQVLFIGTAGNAITRVESGQRGGAKFAPLALNVLLVGGCDGEGRLDTISSFGLIDVYAPNSYSDQYAPDPDLTGGGAGNDQTSSLSKEGMTFQPVDDLTAKAPESRADYGVSFGLPMVANVAAKCKLIHPALTAADLRKLIIATAQTTETQTWNDGKTATQGVTVKMLDPVAAYQMAARMLGDSSVRLPDV